MTPALGSEEKEKEIKHPHLYCSVTGKKQMTKSNTCTSIVLVVWTRHPFSGGTNTTDKVKTLASSVVGRKIKYLFGFPAL